MNINIECQWFQSTQSMLVSSFMNTNFNRNKEKITLKSAMNSKLFTLCIAVVLIVCVISSTQAVNLRKKYSMTNEETEREIPLSVFLFLNARFWYSFELLHYFNGDIISIFLSFDFFYAEQSNYVKQMLDALLVVSFARAVDIEVTPVI